MFKWFTDLFPLTETPDAPVVFKDIIIDESKPTRVATRQTSKSNEPLPNWDVFDEELGDKKYDLDFPKKETDLIVNIVASKKTITEIESAIKRLENKAYRNEDDNTKLKVLTESLLLKHAQNAAKKDGRKKKKRTSLKRRKSPRRRT